MWGIAGVGEVRDGFVLVEGPGELHPAFRADAVRNALATPEDGRERKVVEEGVRDRR